MKRFILFIASFIVLIIGFQLLSGILLTAFFTPVLSAPQTLQQQVSFGETTMPFLLLLPAAAIAYMISRIPKRRTSL
ncbi:hypothetical protein E2R51_16610 [Jeotgalibacillus sp. S-D1]|uniref:hypothetical protein n=1 Tax=Jeotgalibacillus sp. S-D1 TaxID=2552189 RepID=UPI0010593F35|nr:hypothetical protein [Jeotgalibacillus sp. S-D1]TDL30944.1 hypothetical protein E2R51_16610 [Jeotgalibacillus sp. S-D1]